MNPDADRIMIGGVSAAEIASRFGTPTYVYDEQKIRANYRRAYEAFSRYYPDFQFFYAVYGCLNVQGNAVTSCNMNCTEGTVIITAILELKACTAV